MRRLYHLAQSRTADLWTLILAPTVWALHFLFCYAYAAVSCAKRGAPDVMGDIRVVVAIATLVAVLLVLPPAFVGWAQARMVGDPPPHQESTEEDRQRFLGLSKMMLAGLSFVAILFTAIPAFMFPDCR